MILDIALPDGNGLSFYQERISLKKIPTIFLTAEDEEDEQYMGIRMIKKLVEETIYQHTFGMNTLLILI